VFLEPPDYEEFTITNGPRDRAEYQALLDSIVAGAHRVR